MAVMEVLTFPAPMLRTKASVVDDSEFNGDFLKLINDMAETMYVSNGIGLAAPQIGVSKRIMVIDIDWPDREDSTLYAFINPEILKTEGETVYDEGCLSFPGLTVPVQRHEKVELKAKDVKGNDFTLEADGLLAICIQHEMDHLDGITLVDRAEGTDKEMLVSEMEKAPWFDPSLLPSGVNL
jgi:peptide deformylase